MYIKNLDGLNLNRVRVSDGIAKYLEDCGASKLGEENGSFYFLDTPQIREFISKIPFLVRLFGSYEFVSAKGENL